MIRLLLDDMLTDLGYTMAAEAGRLDEALSIAKQGEFDVAILDVNLNGQPITPVVDVLIKRGVPFVFVSGYARRGIPEEHSNVPLCKSRFRRTAWRARSPPGGKSRPINPLFGQRQTAPQAASMNGSSVISSLSGVTATRRSSSAARSVPSGRPDERLRA